MLLALAALGYAGLPGHLQAVAVSLVLGGGLLELRAASPRSPRYVARLRVTAEGRFLLGLARDPDCLVPMAVVSCWTLPGIAVGLAFTGADATRANAILFRDRVPADAWRRLAVRLRHGHGEGS